MPTKTICRGARTPDPVPVRALAAPENVLSSEIGNFGSPSGPEWTVDYLFEQLCAIGWVQSVYDEVADNLSRHLATASAEGESCEDTRRTRR